MLCPRGFEVLGHRTQLLYEDFNEVCGVDGVYAGYPLHLNFGGMTVASE
jgi:hypothetical protein